MKGVVITTENKMFVQDFGDPLHETVGKAVGGWLEFVHPQRLPSPFCMIVDEEGLLKGLKPNEYGSFLYKSELYGTPIVGDIVIMKEAFVGGDRDIVGLTEAEIEYIMDDASQKTEGRVHREVLPDGQ